MMQAIHRMTRTVRVISRRYLQTRIRFVKPYYSPLLSVYQGLVFGLIPVPALRHTLRNGSIFGGRIKTAKVYNLFFIGAASLLLACSLNGPSQQLNGMGDDFQSTLGNVQSEADGILVPMIIRPSKQKSTISQSMPLGITRDEDKVIVRSSTDLEFVLNELNLLDPVQGMAVPKAIIEGFPADMGELETSQKKRLFFHTLLPAALTALDEIKQERARLAEIVKKVGQQPESLVFVKENTLWQHNLSHDDKAFIFKLTRKYRTRRAGELLARVDIVPLSLIMAQGAIESSWGSSRFAVEGNNLFGMWTWGEKGIVPNQREEGKNHKVASYDSILDSVRDYLLTINRVPAYEQFRAIRQSSNSSLDLADGLLHYSERREEYVGDVKRIITYNNLEKYDSFKLSAS